MGLVLISASFCAIIVNKPFIALSVTYSSKDCSELPGKYESRPKLFARLITELFSTKSFAFILLNMFKRYEPVSKEEGFTEISSANVISSIIAMKDAA